MTPRVTKAKEELPGGRKAARFDVGISLNNVGEYSYVLPVVVSALESKLHQARNNASREQIAARIAEIGVFLKCALNESVDTTKLSIALTAEEAEAAAERLFDPDPHQSVRINYLRQMIGVGIQQCMAEELQKKYAKDVAPANEVQFVLNQTTFDTVTRNRIDEALVA